MVNDVQTGVHYRKKSFIVLLMGDVCTIPEVIDQKSHPTTHKEFYQTQIIAGHEAFNSYLFCMRLAELRMLCDWGGWDDDVWHTCLPKFPGKKIPYKFRHLQFHPFGLKKIVLPFFFKINKFEILYRTIFFRIFLPSNSISFLSNHKKLKDDQVLMRLFLNENCFFFCDLPEN